MMNNIETIILFTSEFPFGQGETYIEPELKYLENTNYQIIIVPSYHPKDFETKRNLPKNCKLMLLPKNSKKISKIGIIFTLYFWCGLFELLKCKKFNFTTCIELIKFIYSAINHYYSIKLLLNELNLKKNKVCLYSYWMNSISLSISILKKEGYGVTITRAHGGDLYDDRLPWKHQFLRKYIVNHIDYVCPVSIQGKEYLENRVGKSKNIIPMHLGIEDNNAPILNEKKEFVIVSCSNAIRLKRIDKIIKALSYIKKDYKWIHFGDGVELDNLKKMALDLLPNNSYIFMGQTENKNVLNFYENNQVDLFINLSETEGIPVSIMEALSYAIPVIATNVGGVAELIQNEYNGSLLEPSASLEHISSAINQYMNLTEIEYLTIRQNAKKSFKENWCNEPNYSRFYSLINNYNDQNTFD